MAAACRRECPAEGPRPRPPPRSSIDVDARGTYICAVRSELLRIQNVCLSATRGRVGPAAPRPAQGVGPALWRLAPHSSPCLLAESGKSSRAALLPALPWPCAPALCHYAQSISVQDKEARRNVYPSAEPGGGSGNGKGGGSAYGGDGGSNSSGGEGGNATSGILFLALLSAQVGQWCAG